MQDPQNHLRKKHHSLKDTTPSTSPLQPSRNANIMSNNDSAPKKKFGDIGLVPAPQPSSSTGLTTASTVRKVSALQAQAQHLAQQQQQHGGKRAPRLSTVVQPIAPIASMEVMTNNFEEWMKLATDNKITVTNTWNFALIDYFADLTLLRNGPDDETINFQKASCTLDGCVKIWTSRVDSVATETGKLLSGLAGGDGDEEREEGEEGDEESGEPKATRKTHRSEATLAKSFAPLQLKKFDLEFTVDPLFKKTCADFDEGGAMGLLMNHLGVDGKGRVVFDAGDAGGDEEEEEDLGEDIMVDLKQLRDTMQHRDVTDLNISDTLAAFKFSSDPDSMPDFSTLMGISPSSTEDTIRDDYQYPGESGGEAQDFFSDDDFGGGANFGGGDYGGDDGSVVDEEVYGSGMGGGGLGPVGGGGGVGMIQHGEGHGPFDPRRAGQHDLVMALVGGGGEGDEEGMFDYFDKGFGGKGWAGVEHWKLRKVSRKDPTAVAGGSTAPKPKTTKQPFTLNFSPDAETKTAKQLFESGSKQSLSLPSSSIAAPTKSGGRRGSKRKVSGGSNGGGGSAKKRREEFLLPDDMHFSSRQLLRLFLKPKFSLRMRRDTGIAQIAENSNGEIDENFWAQAAAERMEDGGDDGMDNSTPNPFESQFFNDPDDDLVDSSLQPDDDYDDVPPSGGDGNGGDEDDLWQGTQGQTLRKAKPENVHFAKKAKRVDVKRLKDDIWTGLAGLVPDENAMEVEASPAAIAPEPEPKSFDKVIQNLRRNYPKEKMSEISTSFCFICLLHLANEEGLRIETARFDEGLEDGCMGLAGEDGLPLSVYEDGGDGGSAGKKRAREDSDDDFVHESGGGEWKGKAKDEKSDKIVGELQALKVYKDPNAGRAA